MAETAASTFFSNSSSEMVSDERSMFSMNWIAPICQVVSAINSGGEEVAYQGGQVVSRLATELLLIAEPQNVLDIRH